MIVGWGWGRQKVWIELGSGEVYPKSIPTGDVSNLDLKKIEVGLLNGPYHLVTKYLFLITNNIIYIYIY